MGFRFRRSIDLAGIARVNLSKSGPSLSVGGRGFHETIGGRGRRMTVGVPGTGLSYTRTHTWHRRKSAGGVAGVITAIGVLLLLASLFLH